MARQPPLTEARDALCASLLKPPPQTVIRVLRLAMLVPPGARGCDVLPPSWDPVPTQQHSHSDSKYLRAGAIAATGAMRQLPTGACPTSGRGQWRGTVRRAPHPRGPGGPTVAANLPFAYASPLLEGGRSHVVGPGWARMGPGWARM